MGTSKSTRRKQRCVGGALIFSGRPDPTWNVGEEVVKRSEAVWASLEPFNGARPSPPPLGYRGAFIRCKDKEWFTYGGIVTLRANGKSESRKDTTRTFEKLLLASSPEGVLPRSIR